MNLTRLLLLSIALLILPQLAGAQQQSDPEFNSVVDHPAFTKNFPRVLFDEAHNNFHTTVGRYKPFADLIVSDGYHVVRGRKPFAKPTLDSFKILVIANALGAEDMDDEGAEHPAFTDEECDAVRDWVKDGGALLLIADHAPFGGAADNLGKRFGVDMSKGYTLDPGNSLKDSGNPALLVFSRENKLLPDHPITDGRNASERINRVYTFTGQSLKGPDGRAPFLILGASAKDRSEPNSTTEVSAAGRAQGLAFKFGKGRVVVLGEAAMLSAQLAGAEKRPMGMNVPGSDNRQLALNIMHWLSGLLKER
ncbi:MAG: DUF4350 domain-containing protein [Acidobacteriota bacterium]